MDSHFIDMLAGMLDIPDLDLSNAMEALASSGVDVSNLSPHELADIMREHFAGKGTHSQVLFGVGGYKGSYQGIDDCWFSSDGFIYSPDGKRIGVA